MCYWSCLNKVSILKELKETKKKVLQELVEWLDANPGKEVRDYLLTLGEFKEDVQSND